MQDFILSTKVKLIALTETWLTGDDVRDSEVHLILNT
jgi:hypothetical protein